MSHGKPLPHNITRHVHPKARPETPESAVVPATGIDYLELTERTHHQQVRADRRIGYDALFGDGQNPSGDEGQIRGKLSPDDVDDIDQNGTPA